MTSDAHSRRAFTDTRAFKVMRTLVGLANPLMTRVLASRIGGPIAAAVATQVAARGPRMLRGFGVDVDDRGRLDPAARASAPSRAHIVEILLAPTVP